MKTTLGRTLRAASRLVLWCAVAVPLGAHALVGGAGIDPNTAASPWAGVGSLKVGGSSYTATLIAPGYVLTAAHVVAGAAPSAVSFQLNAGTSFSIAASDIFVNPGFTASVVGNPAGDPTWHDDLAIVRLAGNVPAGVPVYSIFNGSLQGLALSFVGYGGSVASKKTGENVVDRLFADTGGADEVYMFDFDGPDLTTNRLGGGTLGAGREASIVSGDSGSSAFVHVVVNGQPVWQLAGINTFELMFSQGQSSGTFGTGGGGMVLSAYTPWIDGVLVSAVPEPQGWLMLLAGLGALGKLSRRRGL